MSLVYLAKVAFLGWCGTPWPGWRVPIHFPYPSPPDPDPWWYRPLNNIYYVTIGIVIGSTVASHPDEAISLGVGPFMLIPVVQVVAGLIYTNTRAAREVGKVKM